MSCAHCLFSCKQGAPGEFMDGRTFSKALAFAENYGSYITIGGGEPTLHPKFWEFFGLAMSSAEGVWMATNGSVKKIAIALAKISSSLDHHFGVALSLDKYHDPIDQSVIDTFRELNQEIRDPGESIINIGSAYDNGIGNMDMCGCDIAQVKPNGDVYACGCPDSLKIGNIHDLDEGVYNRSCEVLANEGCCSESKLLQHDIDYIMTGGGEYEA